MNQKMLDTPSGFEKNENSHFVYKIFTLTVHGKFL